MTVRLTVALIMIPTLLSAQGSGPFKYPVAAKGPVVEDHFGHQVADPYRWLEDPNSADTKAWVEAENTLTSGYLAQIPERAKIHERLTALWNYERYSPPSKEGPWYIFARNNGLQNQAVIYKTKSPDAAPDVLIDPNTLSSDGTVALGSTHFTDDGKYMAYSLQASGSDWLEWHVREVATSKDLPDVIKWAKFTGAAWLKDGSGFFYGRFDQPKEGEALTAVNKFQKIYFHALGTTQDHDTLVFEKKDQPDWGFSADVTDDGRFLIIYQSEGTRPENRVFVKDSVEARRRDPALPRQVRRRIRRGRQRRRHLLRADRQECVAPATGGDQPGRARRSLVEDSRARSLGSRRPDSDWHGQQPVRHPVDDRRARSGEDLRARRPAGS